MISLSLLPAKYIGQIRFCSGLNRTSFAAEHHSFCIFFLVQSKFLWTHPDDSPFLVQSFFFLLLESKVLVKIPRMILDISWWIPQVLPSNWNSPAQTSAVATAPLSERPGAAAQAAQTARRARRGASRSRWRPMSTTRRAATWSLLRYIIYTLTFFEHFLFFTSYIIVIE